MAKKQAAERPDRPLLALTDGLPTKAAKIRRLAAAGHSRAAIAKFLGIRYQHVRNVLLQPLAAATVAADSTPQLPSGAESAPASDTVHRLAIDEAGRVPMPAALLRYLGVGPGGSVSAWLEEGQIVLCGPEKSMARVRALVARHVPPGTYSADDFIAERRAEAAREAERDAP